MNPELVVISESNNPYCNQALEEFFLLHRREPLLLIYRNRPSVILGRCQNPWRECALDKIRHGGVSMVRRISGGGTVYNDLGNCNFSFFQPRHSFEPKNNLKIIQNHILSYGIKTEINKRNDILLKGKKISGSAYKHTKDRTMHHFSLLVETDRSIIEKYLKPFLEEGEFKGVSSVLSQVARLTDEVGFPGATDFINTIIQSWDNDKVHVYSEEECSLLPGVSDRMREFQEWDWLYGKTPEFTYTICDGKEEELEITVRKGRYYSLTGVEKTTDYE